MNCEGRYFAAGFFHNLCPYVDIVFAQLGVIPRIRNKFFEIIAVAECHVIANYVESKESKKQTFRICLTIKWAGGRVSIKKEKNSSYLIYNIVILGKMAGKPHS